MPSIVEQAGARWRSLVDERAPHGRVHAAGDVAQAKAHDVARRIGEELEGSRAHRVDVADRRDMAGELYVEARDIRKRVLGTGHPDYAMSLNNLAELYRSMGEHAKAEAACRTHLESVPDDANALHLLGSNLLAQARCDEAAQTLQRAVELAPQSGAAHYNLALAHKGTGDSESALASFRSAQGGSAGPRARRQLTGYRSEPACPAARERAGADR